MTTAPEPNDSAITIALAEYAALRAEILSRLSAQAALIGVTLTAIGVIVGIVLTREDSLDLLLVVAITAPALGLFFIDHMRQLALLGLYIRSELWPVLQHQVPNAGLPSWESSWAAYNTRRRHHRTATYATFVVLVAVPAGAVFFVSAVVALALTADVAFSDIAKSIAWLFGLCLTLLFAAAAIALAPSYRATHLSTVITSDP